MKKRDETISLAIIVIALLTLLVLGTSLEQLSLDPGLPFEDLWAFLVNEFTGGLSRERTLGSAADVGFGDTIVEFVKTAYLIALICFPFALILVLRSKESRKRLIRTLIFMILLAILFSSYVKNNIGEELEVFDTGTIPPQGPGELYETTIQDVFTPSIPRWIVLTLSTLIALTLVVISIVIYRFIHPKQELKEPLPEIVERAESALRAMDRGADFRNIILQCYVEMLRIVREQRGLNRQSAVTASEFISSLIKIGLPEKAVVQLTKLFEEVRYGSKKHSYADEQNAIGNLQLIADTFRVTI